MADIKRYINSIVNSKGEWTDYTNKGYTDLANKTAEKAQKYYQQLIDSGNADIANKLKGYDYETARKFADTYNQVAGRTKTRDYLYTLGQGQNMSKSDIDKLISYNDTTGEVSFGGKIVGKPDAVYDGVSYWNDTKPLDNAFNDYIKRTNTTLDTGVKNQAYNVAAQGVRDKNDKLNDTIYSDHADMHSKYDKIYDYANQDVTGTDEYKSAFKNIMPSYNLAAMQGRDNAVASGGASNGGNIDSYAAANALRQQAALTAKGQALAHQAGMDAYNARIGRVQEILSNLGLYNQNTYNAIEGTINNDRLLAQQIFDNEETAKNNDVARKSQIASVTGYSPKEWTSGAKNTFLNDDGTLKADFLSDEFDNAGGFEAIIRDAEARGDKETANQAKEARLVKIMTNIPKYAKYLNGNVKTVTPEYTEDAKQFRMQDETARLLADAANDTEIKKANIGAQSAHDTASIAAQSAYDTTALKAAISAEQTKDGGGDIGLTYSQAEQAIKNGELSDNALAVYNAHHGTAYTKDNPPLITGANLKSNNSSYDWVSDGTTGQETEGIKEKLDDVYNKSSKTVKDYIRNKLEPLITENDVTETELREHLISNSKEYDLEVEDLKKICEALGVDSKWVDDYKNSGLFGWGNGVKSRN